MSSNVGPGDLWTEGTDAGRRHIATRGIVQSGLVLNLDAGVNSSYPGTGTTWTDISGNGNAGTLTNGPTFNSANGGSIVFDGTNDFINIPHSSALNLYPLTISSWTKGQGEIFNKYYSGSFNGYRLTMFTTGVSFYYLRSSGSYIVDYDGYHGGPLESNKWYNIVLTVNSTGGTIYINSKSIITKGWQGIAGNITTTQSVSIGVYPGAGGSPTGNAFNGNISQICLYNRVLTEDEIQRNFNATRNRYGI